MKRRDGIMVLVFATVAVVLALWLSHTRLSAEVRRHGGVVITETVFNIPGIGRLVVDAISQRDYPIIQGVTLIFSGVYVIVNLLVDLSYTLIDPRIRY